MDSKVSIPIGYVHLGDFYNDYIKIIFNLILIS